MPIYEYRRTDGTTFELLQSFSDEPLTHDPETGQAVQRVLHAPAVHFKGSGFYNTDYGTRKRSREVKEAGEGKSSSSGDGSDSKKPSDSKTESKGSSSASSSKD
jgi:putative FmdB family regulatory protein